MQSAQFFGGSYGNGFSQAVCKLVTATNLPIETLALRAAGWAKVVINPRAPRAEL